MAAAVSSSTSSGCALPSRHTVAVAHQRRSAFLPRAAPRRPRRKQQEIRADGKIRIANPCTNADLFWALKGGGGGSFGVVSKLTLREGSVKLSITTPQIGVGLRRSR